jgi:hypothetical protein
MKPVKQLPHYSTHAREYFRQLALDLPRLTGLPGDFEAFLADYLHDSVKFLLPDNGFLMSRHDFLPSMFELQRLPFPSCALEFEADDSLYAQGSGLTQSRKRIALCFDPWRLPAHQQERLSRLRGRRLADELPARAVAIIAVFSIEAAWSASVGLVVVNLDEDKPMTLREAASTGLSAMAESVGARIQSPASRYGLPVTFVTFPLQAAMAGQDAAQAAECLFIDTIDEVRTTYEFLAAVNCSNVGTQEVSAPRMLNERRLKKGRAPFYPYKLLDLRQAPATASGPGGGTHASPNTHLRRGHPRRLHEMHGGRTIWINDMVVNRGAGELPKEQVYKVRT